MTLADSTFAPTLGLRRGFARLFLALLGIVALLVALDVAGHLLFSAGHIPVSVKRLFDLDAENNLPTWFSSTLHFCCALACAGIAFFGRRARSRTGTKRFWMALGICFAFMSLDEAASLHEIFERDYYGFDFEHHWVVYLFPAIALVFLALGAAGRGVLSETPGLRSALLVGLALFLGGAVGVEVLGYVFSGEGPMVRNSLILLEETLEMAGIGLCLSALLQHMWDDTGQEEVTAVR